MELEIRVNESIDEAFPWKRCIYIAIFFERLFLQKPWSNPKYVTAKLSYSRYEQMENKICGQFFFKRA